MSDLEDNTTQLKKEKRKRSYAPIAITPTPLQRRVARHVGEVVRGMREVKTTKELLVKAGVAVSTANHGQMFLKQQGMIVALNELGLTKEKVVPMLLDDLENNPGRRWLGLSIAGKWLGLEAKPEQQEQVRVNNAIIIVQAPS